MDSLEIPTPNQLKEQISDQTSAALRTALPQILREMKENFDGRAAVTQVYGLDQKQREALRALFNPRGWMVDYQDPYDGAYLVFTAVAVS